MDKDLRRLVFTSVALIVVLFVGRTIIGSIWDDGEMRRSVAGFRRSLTGSGDAALRPDRADMVAAAGLVTALDEQLEGLVPRLAYVRPPEFDVPAGASPDLHYIEVLRREQDDLVQAARYIGKSVPQDLGMPVPNPTGLEDVLSALRALHVVHLVVSAGLDAGIDSVDAIRVPPAPRRRGADSGFLKKHPVEFDLVGSPAALRETLTTVASGDPYVALDDVRLEALDEDGETLRCRLSAAILSIDPDQTVRENR